MGGARTKSPIRPPTLRNITSSSGSFYMPKNTRHSMTSHMTCITPGVGWVNFFQLRMSPISTRICVPNLVAVRRSCRKKKGGVQTDRQRKLQLYIVDGKLCSLTPCSLYYGVMLIEAACRTFTVSVCKLF